MKIEYSIIEPFNLDTTSELRFKIILNSDDWILVNQFPASVFTSAFNVDPNNYNNLENSPLNPDKKVTNSLELALVCSWAPDKLHYKLAESGKEAWETDDILLIGKVNGAELQKIVDTIVKDMNRLMAAAYKKMKELKNSCWKKTKSINYRDEAIHMEII